MRFAQGLLGLLLLATGCGPDAVEALTAAETALAAGDDLTAQTAFRDGLERHSEDLPLLLFACDFYLREEVGDHYKPRLALHYASRADRADPDDRSDVDDALARALSAMGQHEDAAEVLRRPEKSEI
jgi:hypothetical protein